VSVSYERGTPVTTIGITLNARVQQRRGGPRVRRCAGLRPRERTQSTPPPQHSPGVFAGRQPRAATTVLRKGVTAPRTPTPQTPYPPYDARSRACTPTSWRGARMALRWPSITSASSWIMAYMGYLAHKKTLIRKRTPLGPSSSPMPRALWQS